MESNRKNYSRRSATRGSPDTDPEENQNILAQYHHRPENRRDASSGRNVVARYYPPENRRNASSGQNVVAQYYPPENRRDASSGQNVVQYYQPENQLNAHQLFGDYCRVPANPWLFLSSDLQSLNQHRLSLDPFNTNYLQSRVESLQHQNLEMEKANENLKVKLGATESKLQLVKNNHTNHLKNCKQYLMSMSNEHLDLQKRLVTSNGERDQYEKENLDLKANVKHLKANGESSIKQQEEKVKFVELERRWTNLVNASTVLKNCNDDLKKVNDDKQKQIELLEKQVNELKTKLTTANTDAKKPHSAEIEMLQKQLSASEGRNRVIKEDTADNEQPKLGYAVRGLTEELEQKKTEIVELKEKVETLSDDCQRLSVENEGLRNQTEHLQNENDGLNSGMEDLKKKASKDQAEYEDILRHYGEELARVNAKIEEVNSHIEMVNSQLETAKLEVEILTNEKLAWEEQLDKNHKLNEETTKILQNEIEQKESENVKLKAENEKLGKLLENQKLNFDQEEIRNDKLLEALKNYKDDLGKVCDDKEKQIQRLEKESQELEKKWLEAKSYAEKLDSAVKASNEQVSSLEDEVKELKAKIEMMNVDGRNINVENKSLQTMLEANLEISKDLQAEVDKLRGQNMALRRENEQITSQQVNTNTKLEKLANIRRQDALKADENVKKLENENSELKQKLLRETKLAVEKDDELTKFKKKLKIALKRNHEKLSQLVEGFVVKFNPRNDEGNQHEDDDDDDYEPPQKKQRMNDDNRDSQLQ